MSVTASDYRSLMLQIEELEEKVAELEKQNVGLTKQNAELITISENLEAKLAKYENPHTPSYAQRFKETSKESAQIQVPRLRT